MDPEKKEILAKEQSPVANTKRSRWKWSFRTAVSRLWLLMPLVVIGQIAKMMVSGAPDGDIAFIFLVGGAVCGLTLWLMGLRPPQSVRAESDLRARLDRLSATEEPTGPQQAEMREESK